MNEERKETKQMFKRASVAPDGLLLPVNRRLQSSDPQTQTGNTSVLSSIPNIYWTFDWSVHNSSGCFAN